MNPRREAQILQHHERMGTEVPDNLVNIPALDDSLQFYYDAFLNLCSERQIGFGEGPIPISAILAYAKHHELNSDDEYDFIHLVRALDGVYLKNQAEKMDKK